jgi:glutamate racemase
MPHSDKSIGIFDSGFGGLTVMKTIREALPFENIVYFGDTARIPYGTKSKETVLRYAIENASFLIAQNIKLLVVACHTACCLSLDTLQKLFPIPVIGVTHPAVEQIALLPHAKKVAILGTRATITSGIYQKLIQEKCHHIDITGIPCQLFVNLVEEGFIDHPLTALTIHEYLQSLTSADTILLGCTHFPLLSRQIQNYFPHPVSLIDPAIGCAQSVKEHLTNLHLLRVSMTPPTYDFYVSDAPEKFPLLGEKFFSYPIINVQKIDSSIFLASC